jgi:hypothetical protein
MKVDAATLFKKEYGKSKNILTDTVVEYGQSNGYYYELARGGQFMGQAEVWGVTVLSYNPVTRERTRELDLSAGGFETEIEARAHINLLGQVVAELPFSGFYETYHDERCTRAVMDTFQDEQGDVPEVYDTASCEVGISWGAIHHQYAKEYVEYLALRDEYKVNGQHLKMTFEEMTSPREYNFESDRLFVHMDAKQMDYIRKTVEALPNYAKEIREQFTDSSGFISNYSNDASDIDWTKDVLDECQYGVILELWFQHLHEADPLNVKEYDDIMDEEMDEARARGDMSNWESVQDAQNLIEKYVTENPAKA